ncbi:MAG: GNAT family N-acetyltransferase, partial [Hyphomicrobiales bacterium]|nr:GNAT family N-acetyltransferase [Hyphomicrobiales bacterium]
RFLRKVDAADEFQITHADSETVERDLDIMLRLWGRMWDAQKGDQSEDIKKVNRIMLMQCFQRGALYLPVMWQGDRPLGAIAIVVDPVKRSYLFKMTGRDQSFKGPPPGFVLHAHAIRHAIANGFRKYDFLLGNEPYKYLFGSEDRRLHNLVISTKSGRNLTGALDPRSLPSAVKLADQLHKSGQLGPAERAYRQILQTDKIHRTALMGLISVLQAKGDTKGAQKMMQTLVAEN